MAFDSSDRPEDFIPERFLTSERPQDPSAYSFGFGRRCVQVFQIIQMSFD